VTHPAEGVRLPQTDAPYNKREAQSDSVHGETEARGGIPSRRIALAHAGGRCYVTDRGPS